MTRTTASKHLRPPTRAWYEVPSEVPSGRDFDAKG